ncbi:MAG: PDZ domain-containing protein, partial [Maioricimonas sp. JB049]
IRWNWERSAGEPVRVAAVDRGSPAEQAGLAPGDRIVSIDGMALSPAADLRPIVHAASRNAKFVIERDPSPEPLTLDVRLRGKPLPFGLDWIEDDAEPDTVVVRYVVPGSPAARLGLQPNDRIHVGLALLSIRPETSEGLSDTEDREFGESLVIERDGRIRVLRANEPPPD